MAKTIEEINERIKKGEAVVVTAEEMTEIVRSDGAGAAAKKVDVVTTGTFGPMCSSAAYFNVGHSKPRIKIGGGTVLLNGVEAYAGLAAVDVFIGATALPPSDPRNAVHPGEFAYGGGHVIEDLVAGKDLRLSVRTYGTDCYPRKELDTYISLADLNEAVLFNPRNAYQNYNCAVNLSDETIYTYMGVLKAGLGNANYCSAGALSPLLNDPLYRTTGIGTRIFLGGGVGYVAWHGTQHAPGVKRGENGTPLAPSGTLALIGDLKGMKPGWLVGSSFLGYGSTLTVGVGIPIPVLDEEVAAWTGVGEDELFTQVVDYSDSYPNLVPGSLGQVSYAELRSGTVEIWGRKVPTGSLSSIPKAREIASTLKSWIESGDFLLTEPVAGLPCADSGHEFRMLNERVASV